MKASDEDDRVVEFLASKEVIDRDNEIIKVKGINLKNYKNNPVVLWSHDKFSLPIGKTIKITKSKDELKMKVQFATAEEYPFADTVYRLVKGGYLNAVSIGFMADYEKIEYDEKNRARIFNSIDLLELSIVPVPANQEALTTGKTIKKALEDEVINEDEFEEWTKYSDEDSDLLEDVNDYEDLKKQIETLNLRVENLEKTKDLSNEDTYFEDILKEFKPAGGASDDDSNTEAKSLDNLLDEFLKE